MAAQHFDLIISFAGHVANSGGYQPTDVSSVEVEMVCQGGPKISQTLDVEQGMVGVWQHVSGCAESIRGKNYQFYYYDKIRLHFADGSHSDLIQNSSQHWS